MGTSPHQESTVGSASAEAGPSSPRRYLPAVACVAVIAILASVHVSSEQSSPQVVANAYVSEELGEEFSVKGCGSNCSRTLGGVFESSWSYHYGASSKDGKDVKDIVVTVTRPVYFLPWRVTDFSSRQLDYR
jgi:hypothetical protein